MVIKSSLLFCNILVSLLSIVTSFSTTTSTPSRPNFLVIEADDQDYLLGSLSVMNTLQSRLINEGTLFTHSLVTTPVCCPSRIAKWTSRYAHNLDVLNLGWCGNYSDNSESWVKDLKAANYTTFLAGKYYNNEQSFCGKNVHIPAPFTHVHAICEESVYYNITYNVDGKLIPSGNSPSDYMTAVLGNASVQFLQTAAQNYVTNNIPFFSYIGVHAPHVPATVAPWYDHAELPAYQAPRTPNYNIENVGKHWQVQALPEMIPEMINASDAHFQRRLRSLLSVDDVLSATIQVLENYNILNNTYIIYTADHGYNLGQFRLPVEKFMQYQNDIRVPFLIRGPNVPMLHSNPSLIAANMDLGQTILELAGLPTNTDVDGRSFAAMVHGAGSIPMSDTLHTALQSPPSAEATNILLDATPMAAPVAGWRESLLTEYWGQGYVWRGPCTNFSGECPDSLEALVSANSNTWSALYVRNATHNAIYGEYRNLPEGPWEGWANWTETYNILQDPYEMTNLYPNLLPNSTLQEWQKQLYAVVNCSGYSNCP